MNRYVDYFNKCRLIFFLTVTLGAGLAQAQQSSETSPLLGRLNEAKQTNNKIIILQLEALKELDKTDTSLQLLIQKLEDDSTNHELWAYLGETYSERSDFEKSAMAYSGAVETSTPPQSDIYLHRYRLNGVYDLLL